jgi:hypothetical protein
MEGDMDVKSPAQFWDMIQEYRAAVEVAHALKGLPPPERARREGAAANAIAAGEALYEAYIAAGHGRFGPKSDIKP